jgi:hypothetical protein
MTMSARSSGESDLFIQGFVGGFDVSGAVPACAARQPKETRATTAKMDAAAAVWDSLEDDISAPSSLDDKLARFVVTGKKVFSQVAKSLYELKRYSKAFVLP